MKIVDHTNNHWAMLSNWSERPWVRFLALTLYYLGILVGLFVLYGKGNFSTPPFIYQNF